jgi:hypothetical protein
MATIQFNSIQFNSIEYWVSNHLVEAIKDELLSRFCTGNNQQAIQGFKLPLLDTPAIATCFLADHGNIAAMAGRQGLTIIASKQDGQGEPVKVARLLGKDLYDIICKTAQPILDKGLHHFQESALLVI